MITKEIVNGEEVFVVDEPLHSQRCNKCMFQAASCGKISCIPAQRVDNRFVIFQPAHDLKTLAAYHAQETTG